MKKTLFTLLFSLVLVGSAYAADKHIYIDTDDSCTGNAGTTANPYCSCTEAETAEQTNISTSGYDDFVFHARGVSADPGTCNFSGWITDVDHQIIYQTDTADTTPDEGWETAGRYQGDDLISTSHYRCDITFGGANSFCYVTTEDYTNFIGLQGEIDANGNDGYFIWYNSTSGTSEVSYNRIHVSSTSGKFNAIHTNGAQTYNIFNNIVDGTTVTASYFLYGGNVGFTINAYNNTCRNFFICYRDHGATPTFNIWNNIAVDVPTSDYGYFGTFNSGSNNANDEADSDMPGAGNVTNLVITDATDFTEPSTHDYTIYDTDSVLYDAGTDGNCASDDLKGLTRTSNCDIGAFEFDDSAGTTTTVPATTTTTTSAPATTTTSTTTTTTTTTSTSTTTTSTTTSTTTTTTTTVPTTTTTSTSTTTTTSVPGTTTTSTSTTTTTTSTSSTTTSTTTGVATTTTTLPLRIILVR